MEKLISRSAALGIPAIVLSVAMAVARASGLRGGAITTTALKSIGPFGMKAGIVSLGLIGLASQSFIDFGVEATIMAVIKEVLKTKDAKTVKNNIDTKWWISKSLKLKIKDYIDKITVSPENIDHTL
ncbi:MAG: hypothetical protein FWE14_08395 [Lachnospiraceae bacterium]|nr:hypothetical protein [Lachnospiraceae bacterium]